MSTRNSAVTGSLWNLLGRVGDFASKFLIGIVIARLLTPAEYGIVGLASIFLAFGYIFADSGFSYALIQKSDCNDIDYSTVFMFNIAITIVLVIVIWLLSPLIAVFFKEPQLTSVLRALLFGILIQALYIVQMAKLKKSMNFKLLTQARVVAVFVSGGIALVLAYKGFGVWSLVCKSLLMQVILLAIFMMKIKWTPALVFSNDSFRRLFSFGSKHLISGVMNSIYLQSRGLVISKFYSPAEFGLYAKADSFEKMSTSQMAATIIDVTFPLFSSVQHDNERLRKLLGKVIRIVMNLLMPLSVVLLVIARPMVILLLGQKWAGVIPYLTLLYIYGAIVPMAPILLNAMNAIGRSDIMLRLEVTRRVLDIPVLFVGALISVQAMIVAAILSYMTSLALCLLSTKKELGYNCFDLLADLQKPLIISSILAIILFFAELVFRGYMSNVLMCTLLVSLAAIFYWILINVFKVQEVKEAIMLLAKRTKTQNSKCE